MPHETTLIATLSMGLVLACAFGFAAAKLRVPPLVGYLVAGVAVGPFTPGYVADGGLAAQLAEVGVILLMFGVGLHFSVADLMAVRSIAVPGAIGQIAVATAIGALLTALWGWSLSSGLVFGLCLSVASTVVLLKALEERNELESANGRIAIGWLIVEDLAMVVTLVLLPVFAGALGAAPAGGHAAHAPDAGILATLAVTLAKIGVFVAVALGIGPRVMPWLLRQVARTGSRELFTLTVLATALGIAFGSAELFGVSFALGAFFAGVVLSESDLSHRAAADSLPLQDAFAVLFFVSVGMLFDPSVVVREPIAVLLVLLVIIVGKSLAALGIVLALGFPVSSALVVSMSLAQIGEFSFILAGLARSLGLLSPLAQDLILAGALLSITLNPLAFSAITPILAWIRRTPRLAVALERRRRPRLRALQRTLLAAKQREEAAAPPRPTPQQLVERFPMFAGLPEDTRDDLLELLRPRTMQPGERLIQVGDPAEQVFFLTAGEVEVGVEGRKLRLGPGDFFGEMALLRGQARTASVTALDYGELLTLEKRDFLEFLDEHPDIRAEFTETAAKRSGGR